MAEEKPQQMRRNGVPTKTLFIKHLELEYWDLIKELQTASMSVTVADAIRYAIKKAAGRL
jgi:hypothetical protein